jgi:cellulose synthase/poly-beta-1,6-N-acetylglucosamine synthase-like glycosyltransferase
VNVLTIAETILIYSTALVYGLTLLALSLYGMNFLYLIVVAWRHRHDRQDAPLLVVHPTVTVQIPIFNERYVAERVIDAVCRMDWPRDRFEIQVLDDSTDGTQEIVAQAVARWREAGVDIVQLHRARRSGFKAGALSAGLRAAGGEFLAIFDADFVPPRDFLSRVMPHLAGDRRIGFVQARWGHLNRAASLLTMLQSLSIDGHFMVEQLARDRGGYVMNFNGTAGVWRRLAIEDSGGWSAGTLTEDLDLSYRAALRGWASRLLPDVVAPAELVGQVSAYRRQQTRWAQGSIECAVRLLPNIWRSGLAWRVKVQSFFHLTGYAIQVLMLIMSLAYPLVVTIADRVPLLNTVYSAGWVFAPIALAPTLFFTYAQIAIDRRGWWRRIPYLCLLTILGSGTVLNSARAIARGLRGRSSEFERTPKSGQIGRASASVGSDYALPFDSIVLGEIGLGLLNLNTARLAWHVQNWGILLYAMVFAAGLAFVAGLSLGQGRAALGEGFRTAWLSWSLARKKKSVRRIS